MVGRADGEWRLDLLTAVGLGLGLLHERKRMSEARWMLVLNIVDYVQSTAQYIDRCTYSPPRLEIQTWEYTTLICYSVDWKMFYEQTFSSRWWSWKGDIPAGMSQLEVI
jgi:hypothetical protein